MNSHSLSHSHLASSSRGGLGGIGSFGSFHISPLSRGGSAITRLEQEQQELIRKQLKEDEEIHSSLREAERRALSDERDRERKRIAEMEQHLAWLKQRGEGQDGCDEKLLEEKMAQWRKEEEVLLEEIEEARRAKKARADRQVKKYQNSLADLLQRMKQASLFAKWRRWAREQAEAKKRKDLEQVIQAYYLQWGNHMAREKERKWEEMLEEEKEREPTRITHTVHIKERTEYLPVGPCGPCPPFATGMSNDDIRVEISNMRAANSALKECIGANKTPTPLPTAPPPPPFPVCPPPQVEPPPPPFGFCPPQPSSPTRFGPSVQPPPYPLSQPPPQSTTTPRHARTPHFGDTIDLSVLSTVNGAEDSFRLPKHTPNTPQFSSTGYSSTSRQGSHRLFTPDNNNSWASSMYSTRKSAPWNQTPEPTARGGAPDGHEGSGWNYTRNSRPATPQGVGGRHEERMGTRITMSHSTSSRAPLIHGAIHSPTLG